MYEIASKRPSFWRPSKLPNRDVSARVPPPVVITATTGTCLIITQQWQSTLCLPAQVIRAEWNVACQSHKKFQHFTKQGRKKWKLYFAQKKPPQNNNLTDFEDFDQSQSLLVVNFYMLAYQNLLFQGISILDYISLAKHLLLRGVFW